MHLVVDLGNTRMKLAIFDEDGTMVFKDTRLKRYSRLIQTYLPKQYTITHAILCNTSVPDSALMSHLKSYSNFIHFTHNTSIPISNCYATPITLGKDRLAAAVAAHAKFPKHNVLFIDMGTCITTNMITFKGEYLGGNISPGIKMRLKAMHTFTDKLPLVDIEVPSDNIGNTTVKALQNGGVKGTFREIDSLIEELRHDFGDFMVILTGGDANLFENWTKNVIFVAPNLVLEGLNEILKYNVR